MGHPAAGAEHPLSAADRAERADRRRDRVGDLGAGPPRLGTGRAGRTAATQAVRILLSCRTNGHCPTRLRMSTAAAFPVSRPGNRVRTVGVHRPRHRVLARCSTAGRSAVPTVAVYPNGVASFAAAYGLGATSRAAWRWIRRLHSQADRTLAPSSAAVDDLRAQGGSAGAPVGPRGRYPPVRPGAARPGGAGEPGPRR